MSNFKTLTKIISESVSEEATLRTIEKTFKKLGASGAKLVYLDAKDLAEGKMSEGEFMHRFDERAL